MAKLGGVLSHESLDDLPGVNIATNGEHTAELLLDHDRLVTYTLTGTAFFVTDCTSFRGTRCFLVKQVLGALWSAAPVAHLVDAR